VLRVLVSVIERDVPALRLADRPGLDLLAPLACAVSEAGLPVTACRRATREDIVELGSSWAKRLGIPERRPAWLLTARKRLT
jgi:hypothetical protein